MLPIGGFADNPQKMTDINEDEEKGALRNSCNMFLSLVRILGSCNNAIND